MDLSQYLDLGIEAIINSSLGPVYRRCPDSNRFSTAETLSLICRNINRKEPKTASAKAVIGKLLTIVKMQESAMFDMSLMTKDLVTSLVNSKTVLADMSKVIFCEFFFEFLFPISVLDLIFL